MLFELKQNSFTYGANFPQANVFQNHMHNEYEILYFIQGDMDYSIEGVMYHLRPRDLLIIRPRAFHYCYPLSSAKYERFVINFTDSDLRPPVKDFLRQSERIYNIPENCIVDNIFSNILAAEKTFTREEMEIYLASLIEHIVLFLKYTEVESGVKVKKNNSRIIDILRYIDQNPRENITAKMLADIFFVSPSWIMHTFRSELGVGVMQYTMRKRILYAQALLQSGMSPADVAYACNFENYATFYRQYRNVLGHSPKFDVTKK